MNKCIIKKKNLGIIPYNIKLNKKNKKLILKHINILIINYVASYSLK